MKVTFLFLILSLLLSAARPDLHAQALLINELMSSNGTVNPDEDGEYGDWVEIHNPGNSTLSMEGLFLSDDSQDLAKWRFPALEIEPGGFLLVHCTGKDRVPTADYYETVIRRGDQWKYRLGDSEPPAEWNENGFDDTSWESGASGFGYGDGDDETVVSRTYSLYARKTFALEDTSHIQSAILNIDFDDAFVAYLNGQEIARSHIGEYGDRPAHDQTGEEHEARMYRSLDPESFQVERELFREGENLLAIQVHNADWGSSDMSLIPYLTILWETRPPGAQGSAPELKFPGTGLHTSFRLSANGETIYLADSLGNVMDSIAFGPVPLDMSYGRSPQETGIWLYFEEPTPGGPNSTEGIAQITEGTVSITPADHFFDESLWVSLSGSDEGTTIRYTTDGSVPGEEDATYEGPISVDRSTILRARVFQDGELPGVITSHNYILRSDMDADNVPILALSTDPHHLWNKEEGLFVNAENRELEKPLHVEFIENDGSTGFNMDAGLKIFGNEPSGGDHQHKLSIFARSKYGYGSLDYHLFPDKPITSFESVVLRNSFMEFWDVVASRLVDTSAVSRQSYRPVVVFLNGEYWGTKFLREKINEHFVASNFGVDPDSVDVIMGIESPVEYYNEEWPIAGDLENYKDLIHYLIDHDLSVDENYEYVSQWIDIHNFITYQATEIFFGNIDWPGNNMKWWRERKDEGIWRWILFDVDAGMGAWESSSYNSMEHATEADGPEQWPNPPWSTFLLRKLLENQEFRDRFVLRSLDLLNTDFTDENVKRELDVVVGQIEDEIRNHSRMWWGSYREWSGSVENLRDWSRYRATRVRGHILDYFDLGPARNLQLHGRPAGAGQIRVNSKLIERFPWKGKYVEDLPLSLEVIPAYGYRFTGWEESGSSESELTFTMEGSTTMTAVFETEPWYLPVVINELSYRQGPGQDAGDWVELFNHSSADVDLSGWVLKDSEDAHAFIIPSGTILDAGEFLVVCRDRGLFKAFYPEVQKITGDMGFGLSGAGEVVRLFNADMELIDWVEYDDFTPWPVEADGTGATLSLIHPDLDNSLAGSWAASAPGGTPGRANPESFPYSIRDMEYELHFPDPWPNPFRDIVHISFSLDETKPVFLGVYDLQGRLVQILEEDMLAPGTYTHSWNAADRAPGVYLCVLRTADGMAVRKLILTGK